MLVILQLKKKKVRGGFPGHPSGKFGHTGRSHKEAATSQGIARFAGTRGAGRVLEQILCWSPGKQAALPTLRFPTSSFRTETMNFCCFKLPGVWCFVTR